MKCRKCRAEIPDGSKFCPTCGAKQELSRRRKTRGNGQGTAYQLPNRTWKAVVTVGYEPGENGRVRRRTRSKSGFKTKKEALAYLPKLAEGPRAKTLTFREVYEMWVPTHRAGKAAMNCYRAAMKHFSPVFHIPLPEITVDDLQECIDDCPKGKRTRQNMKTLCGLLYKYAIPRNLATLNMGQYVVAGGEASESKEALPEDAVEAIAEAVGTVPGADYVLCQCYLGFRPTEFLALDASNYNRKERAFVGGSKTEAGRNRTVTVSPKIQPIVDALVRDKISGPVFCAANGKPMSGKTYRALFYSVLEACGIENPVYEVSGMKRRKYTPHSCRHTFATLMKRVGGSDKDKLELIGHSNAEMLRYYQDVSYEDLRRITDAI